MDEPGSVLTGVSSRANRARVPAPFPVHRWAEHMPAVVVLPRTAQQVSEIVKLANRAKIPVVPRAGGTGLNDGAVPLRGGIMVDVKRMNQIHEIDLADRTVTVGPGINMLKLNEELKQYGVFYPDTPASYPCSLVGGRIACSGWSLLGSRFGHTRDLVVSFEIVLPTGEIIRVGDGGGKKVRKSSTGYHLKQLFMGHQGTLGIVTEATLELVPRPEAEFAAFFAFDDFGNAHRTVHGIVTSGIATLAGTVLFDEKKIEYLRRDDEAFIPMPGWVNSIVATALYGTKPEVREASKLLMDLGRKEGGRYTGDEMAVGDWASRHDRYANPLHGRVPDGTVAPMSWHCEDASLNWSVIPKVREEWTAITQRYIDRYGGDLGIDEAGAVALALLHRDPGEDAVEPLGVRDRARRQARLIFEIELRGEDTGVRANREGGIFGFAADVGLCLHRSAWAAGCPIEQPNTTAGARWTSARSRGGRRRGGAGRPSFTDCRSTRPRNVLSPSRGLRRRASSTGSGPHDPLSRRHRARDAAKRHDTPQGDAGSPSGAGDGAESYFIPSLWRRFRVRRNARHLLGDLAALPQLRLWGVDLHDLSRRVRPDASFADVMAMVYGAFAAGRERPRYGDKTTTYREDLGILERAFPGAQYLHVIRDGRDAALSYQAMGIRFGNLGLPKGLGDFAWRWRIGIARARRFGEACGSSPLP